MEEEKNFIHLAIRQGFLTAEKAQLCKNLQQEEGPFFQKKIWEIVLAKQWMEEEDIQILLQDKESKRLLFGGYEVKSILGEGGLGVVYLAKQLSMKRYVALKVLYSKWMKDMEFRKRFLLEARVAGKLSHPNLIQVFDIGYDQGRYYFSMEYVKGKTVDEMIERDEPLPLDKALDIALQTLDALDYIWSKNLVHRDIKPSNIIINMQDVAKLGDFGFVKAEMNEKFSTDDFVLGTPDYMSPEQAMGKETLDYRSDIYSLGSTLYRMLTASVPYDGSESMVIKQHIKAAIPSPKTLNPSLPDGVCTIIEKMMAKSPQDRYQNYEDLKRDMLLVKQGSQPKVARIDAGKSTIARAEELSAILLPDFYKMESKIVAFRYREYFYQAVIFILCILLLILLFTGTK
ncbi:MAG: serine/threonine protein kinase [Candidatus Brocadiae bacterium]|nr:serine/threonine protein kinase [Candidatus Brocadiia bacterium]